MSAKCALISSFTLPQLNSDLCCKFFVQTTTLDHTEIEFEVSHVRFVGM